METMNRKASPSPNNLITDFIKISLILLSFHVSASESITCESNGNTDYPYNLPIRNIVNCPGFETFTFSCHNYHVIDVDSLKFSPYSADPSGECTANWSSECKDNGYALEYLKKTCSGHNSCTINSKKLRSMSKCILNEVTSVSYKCVPTWEVMDVPIKCDLCKNVTFTTGIYPNFGFLHSSWYGSLDPYVTCVSQIQNKPNHIIVIYTVNGFIGLDQILIETYNEFGVHISKVVSGNLTTNLILTSNYNVNITILPQSYQIFNQPNFLLYYYVVPKCEYMLCPNTTIVNPPVTFPTVTYLPTIPTTTETPNTFAPPLIADKNKKHRNGHAATISDAWLAAILGLVYAILMIFAVLVAIYFRRRRKGRIFNENQIILSPSMMSMSRVITPATQSQISLSEASMHNKSNMNQFNNLYLNDQTSTIKASEYNHIYSREQTYEEYDSQNQRMQQDFDNQRTIERNDNADFSQVINNEDNFFGGGRSMLVNSELHHQTVQYNAEYSQKTTMHQERSVEMNSTIYPSSLRGNTLDLNTIRSSEVNHTTMSKNSDASQKSGYRADAETLRTTNSDDFGEISSQALKIDRINTSELIKQTNSHISTFNKQETKKTITLNEENNITVNLFQPPANEKETQEMTMFVENSLDDFNTSRQFKIDLNK